MSIKITRDKDNLKIEVPLEKPWPSKSGKTMLVASTHGSKMTDVLYRGRNVTVLLNAYVRPTEEDVERLQQKQHGRPKKSGKKPG